MNELLSNTVDNISDGAKTISDKYEAHILEEAIEVLQAGLVLLNLEQLFGV